MSHHLEQSSVKNVRAALTLDRYTLIHSHDVSRLARRLGLALGLGSDQVSELQLAGKLHDLGKVAVPSRLLLKPGPLSDDEWKVMRAHAETGAWLAETLGAPPRVVEAIRQHHERLDGSGYPQGLRDAQVDEYARILAVADVYSAMTHERAYRGGHSKRAAFAYLRSRSGAFDSKVVGALEDLATGRAYRATRSSRLRIRRLHSIASVGN